MTTTNDQSVTSKERLSDHDFQAFKKSIDEFKNESDRAAVILGAAKLDVLLYQLLQAALRPCTGRNDELLDGDSPLATFSARITLTHRLGLIDDEFCRALHLIRKVRNSFAHELSGISLESGAHRDRIRELVAPLKKHESFEYLLDRYFGDRAGPAGEFRTAVALASLRLEGAFENLPTFNLKPWSLIPHGFKRTTGSSANESSDGNAAPKDTTQRTT